MTAPAFYTYKANNTEQTGALAAALAVKFEPGTVITLDGDLGAGKTTFSQAVAKAIGVKGIVNSPTFTLIKEYEGESLPFYHMDVYRLSLEEADDLGLDDYFYGGGVTLIEWSSLIEELLPNDRLSITIEHCGTGEQERMFRITPHGSTYIQWCEQLKENGIL
ncbi:tRNA (adenosine(37)-N6)-threonylcarbamoyltransferase complex ATPase subunit type 1 TsaE [Paenibacillus sp. LMG 31456]|uniref:tRNA threonylcarbamoyladenosine biosynthesis protein TsaE n=1 Tax=Paenibacillus foliorum TaxID=2654974 RepID=A0A972GVI8_9BACL|nr:tRNA (adenosine(37)-N6)-threonylcarbamoyltransferase complex ATPase subunit type 1 TsaE [Paenibacillus foliorum]NOU94592.1 tRNA (adenosine(37)-N6)-threonylcarbamoyltransferase complex ATPase subunit type 1 TsaE [Paenibacillus foliorum]